LVNEAGHRQAIEQLRASRAALDPVRDIRLYVEATHGIAIHAIAAGFWRRHGVDFDQHQGMVRRLRDGGYQQIAEAFADLERIRTGRWYGGQGNGGAAHRVDELLAQIEEWSLG
jgi:ribulose bisphosphate carboxylase small subunit